MEERDLVRELQERLDAHYRPGCYAEGEELSLAILEELDPDWEWARLYLMLFLSAQDASEEALSLAEELSAASLFKALDLLVFSGGSDTDRQLYGQLQEILRERGLTQELESYFATEEKPWPRADITAALRMWE